jgi:hypothetical protein
MEPQENANAALQAEEHAASARSKSVLPTGVLTSVEGRSKSVTDLLRKTSIASIMGGYRSAMDLLPKNSVTSIMGSYPSAVDLLPKDSVTSIMGSYPSAADLLPKDSVTSIMGSYPSAADLLPKDSVTSIMGSYRSAVDLLPKDSATSILTSYLGAVDRLSKDSVASIMGSYPSAVDVLSKDSVAAMSRSYTTAASLLPKDSVVAMMGSYTTAAKDSIAAMIGSYTTVANLLPKEALSTITSTLALTGSPQKIGVIALLEGLGTVSAQSFLDAFKSVDHEAGVRKWVETAAKPVLHVRDATATILAGLVDEELSLASAQVGALDPATRNNATAVDVLLILLERLKNLGLHPKFQEILIALVVAIVGGIVSSGSVALWQARTSNEQHQREVAEDRAQHSELMAEVREQTVILRGNADVVELVNLPAIRGSVIRKAHLRSEANSTSKSWGLLEIGDEVLILDRNGAWLHVRAGVVGGEIKTGWVYSAFVKAKV